MKSHLNEVKAKSKTNTYIPVSSVVDFFRKTAGQIRAISKFLITSKMKAKQEKRFWNYAHKLQSPAALLQNCEESR